MPLPLIGALLVRLAIGVAVLFLSYVFRPSVKQEKTELQEMDNPVADVGRPMGVLFGTKTIKSQQIMWYGEKTTWTRDV
jgi:predicted phage tail protein